MDGNSKIHRNPSVVYRELEEGEGVLLHLESGQYHGLNRTGSLIWMLIGDGSTVSEIAGGLGERVDDLPPDIEREVAVFLDGLLERDLVLAG